MTLGTYTVCPKLFSRQLRFTKCTVLNQKKKLKASCMQLINALVLTPEDLEFRVHLRNEFMRDGLMDHLESLLTTDNEELRTQVQTFIEHKENDFDELRLRLDNISFNMQFDFH
ncbi:hypothetical protein HELRODRAFT_179472 [Helobdella robusta]|uniref:Formin FH3 domain-containing protein n=1 Tax=Helobdella robusta TaxID=6412 RepID=T1FER4_HELRO|nr:hypothetical protein HELRODRAFT_179472 [Helobdella robusta]ESN95399.1 hypothetical protein HELRODRAFT_179472 [Helobdella robusta]